MSDCTPSTTFRTGPPSPSSPAAGSLKESHQLPVSSDHIPQTPTSPPLMSVSNQSHVSHFASSQASPNQATTQPATISSPPSSVPMSTQVSQQPAMSLTNSFPTPASSVSGHPANATSADDVDHKSFTTGMLDSTRTMEDQEITEHRQSDRDQPHGLASGSDQHTTDVDAMDVDKVSAPRSESRGLGLDSLQKDFTSAFHLCKSCKSSPCLTAVAAGNRAITPVARSVDKLINTVFFVTW